MILELNLWRIGVFEYSVVMIEVEHLKVSILGEWCNDWFTTHEEC